VELRDSFDLVGSQVAGKYRVDAVVADRSFAVVYRDFEKPSHNITLSAFCIDRHEVTANKYRVCSDRGACRRAGRTNHWKGLDDDARAAPRGPTP